MRIFYAAESSPNPDFISGLWRSNLYEALVDLEHDVVEFDFDLRETFRNLDPALPVQKAFIQENQPRLSAELIRQIETAHSVKPIELFFSYFYDACVTVETIDQIKAMGIKTVNWYCNGSYQLHLVQKISPHYDWCLVPEKFRLKDYKALGANPIYCQEAANPKLYKPYDLPKEFDVTFVGQAYGDRPDYIKYLKEQDIDVRVWGAHWSQFSQQPRSPRALRFAKKWIKQRLIKQPENSLHQEAKVIFPAEMIGGVLSDEEMIQMYSRSKINLGFSSCGDTHQLKERIVQIRLRDFEVPMSGGFYMVEYMEELEEFFEIDKEVVCYRSPEDLADKIKYYLKNNSARESIRQAGYERCRRDHTWQRRFTNAFHEMGLT